MRRGDPRTPNRQQLLHHGLWCVLGCHLRRSRLVSGLLPRKIYRALYHLYEHGSCLENHVIEPENNIAHRIDNTKIGGDDHELSAESGDPEREVHRLVDFELCDAVSEEHTRVAGLDHPAEEVPVRLKERSPAVIAAVCARIQKKSTDM